MTNVFSLNFRQKAFFYSKKELSKFLDSPFSINFKKIAPIVVYITTFLNLSIPLHLLISQH